MNITLPHENNIEIMTSLGKVNIGSSIIFSDGNAIRVNGLNKTQFPLILKSISEGIQIIGVRKNNNLHIILIILLLNAFKDLIMLIVITIGDKIRKQKLWYIMIFRLSIKVIKPNGKHKMYIDIKNWKIKINSDAKNIYLIFSV
mgnify:CR=1 FL=1